MRVIDSNKVSTGLLVLMGTQVAGVLLSFAYGPMMGFTPQLELVFAGIWLLIALVMCVGLAHVALGTDPGALAWVVLVLELASTVLSELLQHGADLVGVTHGLRSLLSAPLMLASLAERGLLLWLLVLLLRERHPWGLMVAVGVFGVSAMRMAVPFALSLGVIGTGVFGSPLYGVAMTGVTVLTSGGSLVLLWFARQTVLEGGDGAVPAREAGLVPPTPQPAASPGADFAIGAVLLLIGIGVTAVSMSAASGGGRYVVATGAIGVGIGRLIRGFIKLGRGS